MPTTQTRKTRIVCISDTHNQTPKLPRGDILIHAGDLTNQGSYSELQKTVAWLEKTDFEAKIIVAGNHDIPLDPPSYHTHATKYKWPCPQNPEVSRALLTHSPSLTYLENTSATIYLTAPTGPRTCLKVFGSPSSPGQRGWAFQYADDASANSLWSKIPDDADVVVTHTPARGHVDSARDGRTGCGVLAARLAGVRPKMHVCGHIHEARGAERVRWGSAADGEYGLVQGWRDPGEGNGRISLLDLSGKGGRALENGSAGLARCVLPAALRGAFGGGEGEGWVSDGHVSESVEEVALRDSEARWRQKAGGAIEVRGGEDGADTRAIVGEKAETAMINAAFLGPRIDGRAKEFSKPIVVDVDLPVWRFSDEEQ